MRGTHSSHGHKDPYSCRNGCTVFYCLESSEKFPHVIEKKG